jgi:hypothetical protein
MGAATPVVAAADGALAEGGDGEAVFGTGATGDALAITGPGDAAFGVGATGGALADTDGGGAFAAAAGSVAGSPCVSRRGWIHANRSVESCFVPGRESKTPGTLTGGSSAASRPDGQTFVAAGVGWRVIGAGAAGRSLLSATLLFVLGAVMKRSIVGDAKTRPNAIEAARKTASRMKVKERAPFSAVPVASGLRRRHGSRAGGSGTRVGPSDGWRRKPSPSSLRSFAREGLGSPAEALVAWSGPAPI